MPTNKAAPTMQASEVDILGEELPAPEARQETLTRASFTLAAALELNEFLNRLETSFGWVTPLEPGERPGAGLQAIGAASPPSVTIWRSQLNQADNQQSKHQ